jgi:Flp pilus assembly protein TadG
MSPERTPARRRRSGMMAVQVALSLTVLVGILALTVDAGLLFAVRRQAQATADAGALAAAADLYKGNGATAAQTSAKDVGVSNGFARADIVVNIPPSSPPVGYFDFSNGTPGVVPSDKNSYVEVIATYNQVRFFSNIFGGGTIPVSARAVARGTQSRSTPGILVLTPTGTGLSVVGNGTLTESGGAVVVNSTDTSAAHDTGNGSMTAQEFDVTGSIAGIGGLTTTPTANQIHAVNGSLPATSPTPDPLRYLPAPTQPPNGTITQVGNVYTLTPGSFTNLPNFTSKDTVIFQQASAGNGGIYYLASGGLTANGAILQMDTTTSGGIMIYNAGTGQNDGINIAGNSSSSTILSGLTSGIYTGLLFFQARNAPEDLSITGNGNFTMTGTIYAADATVKAAGNGSNNTIASQIIANAMTISGNGTVTVNDVQGSNPKTRQLQLVE